MTPNLRKLSEWADAALSFIYPEVCQICGEEPAAHARAYVCDRCRSEVKLIEPPFCSRCGLPRQGEITNEFVCAHCDGLDLKFSWARSAAKAEGPVLDAIHKYKYSRKLWFEAFLAELLIEAAAAPLRTEPWDALVPVPLFPVKHREREFNQAEELSKRLSRATAIPTDRRLIKRALPTRSQTRLTREERSDNVRGAFAVNPDTDCEGKNYVLIDDVFTTGATTNACAKALLRAGAQRVAVWTVARGVWR